MDLNGLPLALAGHVPAADRGASSSRSSRETAQRRALVALGTALVACVLSLLLLLGYLPERPGFQYVEQLDWIPLFGIQYKLGVDGLSVALVVLTTTLTWISILASLRPDQGPGEGVHDLLPHPRGRA